MDVAYWGFLGTKIAISFFGIACCFFPWVYSPKISKKERLLVSGIIGFFGLVFLWYVGNVLIGLKISLFSGAVILFTVFCSGLFVELHRHQKKRRG